jgi:hypothetical protein
LLPRFFQSTVLHSCNSTLLTRPTESFPSPPHEGVLGENRCRSTHSQPRRSMESSRQLHSPAFTPGDEPRYPLGRRLDGPQIQSGEFGGEKNFLSVGIHIRPVARPMNTVGAAACNAGACIYMRLYTYKMVYYTYTVCVYKRKRRLCQEYKISTSLHKALSNSAPNISHVHTVLKMSCLQSQRVNSGNTWVRWGVTGCLAG